VALSSPSLDLVDPFTRVDATSSADATEAAFCEETEFIDRWSPHPLSFYNPGGMQVNRMFIKT
jgi:hypothetical protein